MGAAAREMDEMVGVKLEPEKCYALASPRHSEMATHLKHSWICDEWLSWELKVTAVPAISVTFWLTKKSTWKSIVREVHCTDHKSDNVNSTRDYRGLQIYCETKVS
jgi:hypothetical protein